MLKDKPKTSYYINYSPRITELKALIYCLENPIIINLLNFRHLRGIHTKSYRYIEKY